MAGGRGYGVGPSSSGGGKGDGASTLSDEVGGARLGQASGPGDHKGRPYCVLTSVSGAD
jgi:hypothetical protein